MSKVVLGRGLASLLPPRQAPADPPQAGRDDGDGPAAVAFVDLEKIVRNPFQPRAEFDPAALDELKRSIQERGVIQPVTVRRVELGYQLITGERRVRAAREAGLARIPAYILRVDTDEEMLELALIENLQREDLNPMEVAVSYKRLMEECRLTQELVAQRVGKDRSTVTNALRLLKLPGEIQQAVRKGEIGGGHARALLAIEDETRQIAVFRKAVARGLSVRAVETLARGAGRAGKAPHRLSGPSAGATQTAVSSLEERLRQLLGTRVAVRPSQEGRGEIVIEYYSADDLDRLLDLFAVIQDRMH